MLRGSYPWSRDLAFVRGIVPPTRSRGVGVDKKPTPPTPGGFGVLQRGNRIPHRYGRAHRVAEGKQRERRELHRVQTRSKKKNGRNHGKRGHPLLRQKTERPGSGRRSRLKKWSPAIEESNAVANLGQGGKPLCSKLKKKKLKAVQRKRRNRDEF